MTRGNWHPKPGGQSQFMADFARRYVCLEGGWGAGKSWCGARKLLWLHLYNARDSKGKPTLVPSAIVAPTYGNARDFCIPAFMDSCQELGLEVVWKSSDKEFRFRHRPIASVKVRTADAADRITGWEVGAFWGDEAARWKEDQDNPRNDALTQIQGRLRHPRARKRMGVFTYTNEGDATAIYKFARDAKIDCALYRAKTKDNDVVRSFYESLSGTLTPELQDQYLEGGAANLRGKNVYPYFDGKLNVDDSLELQRSVPLDLSIDFNIRPGMHAELGQHFEGEDMFTVVHEFHEAGLSVRDLVILFGRWIEQSGGWQWPMLRVFGDATSTSRWAGTGASSYDILAEGLQQLGIPHEFYIPRSNPFVEDRVQSFNVAMRDLRGDRHWRCHPRCEKLIEDLRTMRRDKDGRVDKQEETISHASDAEGYRVWYLRPITRLQETSGGGYSVVT